MDASEPGKLHRLQVLRGVAALIVVLTHALTKVDRINELSGAPPLGWKLDGAFGVDIFFVISGFIMVHTSRGQWGSARASARFLLRRALRIVPLYWLFTTVEVALRLARPEAAGAPAGLREIGLSLAFIPYDLQDGLFRPVLGLGWTLDFEMLFYLVFALGLAFRPVLGLAVVAGCLTGAVLAGAAFAPSTSALAAWTSPILLEFGLGAGLALAYGILRSRGGAFSIPAPLAIGFAIIVLENILWWNAGASEAAIGWRPFNWLAATAIVAMAVLAPEPRETWWRLPLERLGDSSYSLYLSHPLVLTVTARTWMGVVHDPRLTWAYLPGAVLACIAFGWVVHRGIERPLLGMVRHMRRSAGREPNAAIDPAAFVSLPVLGRATRA